MKRRGLSLAILGTVLPLLVACGGESPAIRNAVVILIDTCRYDDVGRVTPAGPVTPNIDRFGEDASRFARATAPAPWTLPSVASLLTSVYPTVHGAVGQYPEFSRLRDEIATGPETLSRHGIETAAFINVPFLDPVLGLDRGFGVYDYSPSGRLKLRRAGETIDAAIGWLETNREKRFFLFVHLFDPHMDFDPLEPHRSRFLQSYDGKLKPPFEDVARWRKEKGVTPEIRDFARALYRAEIAGVDEACGRFLAYLDESGLSAETAVVITADHGEEFWDHGSFEHGHTLYEELIHVPLLIRAPRREWVGESDRRVGLVDVMPTLFDLLGVPTPDDIQGESLVPLLEGHAPPDPQYRFSEATLYRYEWKTVVSERFKYSYDEVRGNRALFDLVLDPSERFNLVSQKPEIEKEMAQVLSDWIREMLARTDNTVRGEQIVNMEEEVIEKLRELGYIE